jgi:hypothetical protein
MATKYCDHGAYGDATGVGSTSGSSTTLTIASTSAGAFGVGSELTGTGITPGTYVTVVNAYTGASGTLTMSAAMTVPASTAITAKYGQPLVNPTAAAQWGKPQDGDGSSKTASTASAVTSIDMSAATAVAGNTFIVMGATLTCVASGATVNNFNAGSGATLVANLVAAINRTTATALVVAQAAGWKQFKIQDAVFARVGSPSTTLEIMTRAGSAVYNGLTSMAWSGITGLSGTPTWSGGVGGCWGHFLQTKSTYFPSALALANYGLYSAMGCLAGEVFGGDICIVRANKVLMFAPNTSVSQYMRNCGTNAASVVFKIDDGTEWPADGATPIFKISETHTGNFPKVFGGSASTFLHIVGKRYASGDSNLLITNEIAVGSNVATSIIDIGWPGRIDNLDLISPGTPTASPGPISSGFSAFRMQAAPVVVGNKTVIYKAKVVNPGFEYVPVVYANVNNHIKADFIDCDFILTAAASAWTRVILPWSGGSTQRLVFDACRFSGFVPGTRLVSAGLTPLTHQMLILKDCDLGGINILGPNCLVGAGSDIEVGTAGVMVVSKLGDRTFALDRPGKAYFEWSPAAGRPTLNAKLIDLVTPWSIYGVTSPTPGGIYNTGGAEAPRLSKRMPTAIDLPEAPRTFTVNFLLESTLTWNRRDVSVQISYQATDGTLHVYDSYDYEGSALSSSSASWSATTWNSQSWAPKEFSVTTPEAVKAESEVGITFLLHSSAATNVLGVIIDPEVLVA